jgi:hypothetical protein
MFGLAHHFWLVSNSRSGKMLCTHLRSFITYDVGMQFPQQPASGERILTVTRSFGGVLRSRTLATASAKYYTPDGKLIFRRGRAGAVMPDAELERLGQRLRPDGR